jgi:hypothetical protein
MKALLPLLLTVALALSSCAQYTANDAVKDATVALRAEESYRLARKSGKVSNQQKAVIVHEFIAGMTANHPSPTATQVQQWSDLAFNLFESIENPTAPATSAKAPQSIITG